jgi:hypothetical protein
VTFLGDLPRHFFTALFAEIRSGPSFQLRLVAGEKEPPEFFCSAKGGFWPIATGNALTARRRFRTIADMDRFSSSNDLQRMVESRCGAVSVGRTYLFPPLSSGGALVVRPWLRFHIPLIEPDMQISRIRLSDKTSRLCLRVQRHLRFLNPLRSL